eukprot:GFUD01019760.1.p1 GENE.GFUD01019760.1~~GFUD01019760.1.p1  ORF type:complete len:483 (-),score=162.43 GFUD01019760.1:322-1770(-)
MQCSLAVRCQTCHSVVPSMQASAMCKQCDCDWDDNHYYYELIIPHFWSNREKWPKNCSISANIEIGQQPCQLQVYPTAGQAVKQGQEPEGGETDVLNVSDGNNDSDGGDMEVLDEESVIIEEEEEEVVEGAGNQNVSEFSGLTVELVNWSTFDMVIDGFWAIGGLGLEVQSEKLPRAARTVILNVGSKDQENIKKIRGSAQSGPGVVVDNLQDLRIRIDFVLSASPPDTGDAKVMEIKAILESSKVEVSEVNRKVSEISPKLAEMRDQFQAGMESMQDILLETPLSAEVSDLTKHISRMKVEIASQIETDMKDHFKSLKESFLPVPDISAEIKTLRNDIASQFAALQAAVQNQTNITNTVTSGFKQDIIQSVTSLKDHLQASSSTSNPSGFAEVQFQLEMLQDSVLTAVSTPAAPVNLIYPECPYCMEELQPPAKIFQCLSGHLICETCQTKPAIRDCPSCHEQFCGRNRGLETFLQRLAGQ